MSTKRWELHTPYFEAGSGYYGETLGKLNEGVVKLSQDILLSFVETVPVKSPGVFTVGDYGTNDGYVSMPLIRSIIRQMRMIHGEELAIQVIYEDQEKNDFNSLFNRLSGEGSYLPEFNNVYPMATNASFYKQCVSDGACDVIFSSTSLHWMDKTDFRFKDCLFHCSPEASAEELRCFQQASDRDWIKFLLPRARELKQGGLLMVLLPSRLDDSKVPVPEQNQTTSTKEGHVGSSGIDLWRDLEMSWKQLREEGINSKAEYEDCTVHLSYRSAKDMTSPFEAATSPVTAAGLTLVHFDQIIAPCRAKSLWREKLHQEGVNDKQWFADMITVPVRVSTEASFRISLSDMRNRDEKDAIIDHFYRVFNRRISSVDPETYKSEAVMARLVARKS